MEGRILVLFLSGVGFLAAVAGPSSALAAEGSDVPEQVIQPEIDRREIKRPRIDTEDFEIGAYAGIMSVEDFGTNTVVGARLAYHITESFFIEGNYGQTETSETSFELLSGGVQLLADDERDLTYYNISFGYNVLPGEIFIGRKRAFNSAFYVVAGAGSTEFAGDDHFTLSFGMGYRLLPTDFMSLRVDVRDHMFDMDLFGEEKTTHNIEAHLGLNIFF